MKKKFLFLLIFVHTDLFLYAQNWQPVGRGANPYAEVRCLYADTLANRLYIGGNFSSVFGYTDTVGANGIAYWDGNNWFPLGSGEWANSVLSIARYGSDIYAGGNFTSMGGIPNTIALARWDGSNWNSVTGRIVASELIGSSTGAIYGLKVKNNKLYAMGVFDSISGIEAHSIASWDGINFNNVYAFPSDNSGGDPNALVAMDSFQGEIYVGGNYENIVTTAIKEIARWNGSQWLPLQNGILGGIDWVDDMVVYKNELYVSGEIRKADGNIANGLMIWNGVNWREFSPNVNFGGQIRDLNIINNVLYIAGGVNFVGDTSVYGLSKYDGTTFSTFGGVNNPVYSIVGLNGNLYIATDRVMGTDTVNYIAQWMGGNLVDSSIVVVTDVKNILTENNFIIYPNPSQSKITIEFDLTKNQNNSIKIKNTLGQTIKTIDNRVISTNKIEIDVSKFANGLYFVQIQSENTILSKKFVKQ